MLVALMATGCSRSVTIPPGQFEEASREKAKHRIELSDGSDFTVRRFAVSDSTVVIHELDSSDERYGRAQLPLSVPRQDVTSISKQEVRYQTTFWVVGSALVLGFFLIHGD